MLQKCMKNCGVDVIYASAANLVIEIVFLQKRSHFRYFRMSEFLGIAHPVSDQPSVSHS